MKMQTYIHFFFTVAGTFDAMPDPRIVRINHYKEKSYQVCGCTCKWYESAVIKDEIDANDDGTTAFLISLL